MLQDDYRRDMDAVRPTPAQMDRLYRVLYQEEHNMERPVKKRPALRTAALAAALCGVLAITAVAVSPTLRQALADALGGFAPYAQAQDNAVTAQGIRVKAVSALADSYTLQVYAEITDLTGDRLAHANFSGGVEMELEGELSGLSGHEVLHYDPDAKTALVRYTEWTGGEIADDLPATLKIGRIQPDFHYFHTQDIPLELLTAQVLATDTTEDGSVVLAPGQTDYPLPAKDGGDGVTVSSLGFASDGKLHILYRFPDGAVNGKQYALAVPTWKDPRAAREGTPLPKLPTNYGVRFERGGKVYYDTAIDLTPADLPDVAAFPSATVTYSTQAAIDGDWEVPITFTRVNEAVSPISGAFDGYTLTELRLSPMNVILSFTSEQDHHYLQGCTVTVYLADGTVLTPQWGEIGMRDDGDAHMSRWVFDRPVEVHDVTGVAIGSWRTPHPWMIPVENGVAGAGYWLSAPPQ